MKATKENEVQTAGVSQEGGEEEKPSHEVQTASSDNQASCPSEMDFDDDIKDNPLYQFFQKHKKGPLAHKYVQVRIASSA